MLKLLKKSFDVINKMVILKRKVQDIYTLAEQVFGEEYKLDKKKYDIEGICFSLSECHKGSDYFSNFIGELLSEENVVIISSDMHLDTILVRVKKESVEKKAEILAKKYDQAFKGSKIKFLIEYETQKKEDKTFTETILENRLNF